MNKVNLNCNWDLDKIKKGINAVKSRLGVCKNHKEKDFLLNCLEYYETILDTLYEANLPSRNICSLSDDLKYDYGCRLEPDIVSDKDYIYPLSFLKEVLNIVEDIRPYLLTFGMVDLPKRNLGISDILSLSSDMFNATMNSYFKDSLNNLFRDMSGRLQVINVSHSKDFVLSNGCFIPDIFYKTPYIFLKNNGSMDSVITMSHELGHANEYVLNNEYYIDALLFNKMLSEVSSMFFELVSYDYFIERGVCVGDFILSRYNFVSYIYSYSENFRENLPKSSFKKDKYRVPLEFHEAFNYLISFLISIQLYYQYLDDKVLALDNLKRFIEYDKTASFEELVGVIGVGIGGSRRFVKNYTNMVKSKGI